MYRNILETRKMKNEMNINSAIEKWYYHEIVYNKNIIIGSFMNIVESYILLNESLMLEYLNETKNKRS